MSKKNNRKKVRIYTEIEGTVIRIQNIPLLYDIHVNNILQHTDEESDIRKYKTLYIPETEYDALSKQMRLKPSATKVDIYDTDGGLQYMVRSAERREADMEMLIKSGKIAQ